MPWARMNSANRLVASEILPSASDTCLGGFQAGRVGCGGQEQISHQSQLLKGGQAVVQADLLHDLTPLEPKYGRPGEAPLPPGRCRQRSDDEVTERSPGVGSSTLPAANHKVSFEGLTPAPRGVYPALFCEVTNGSLTAVPRPITETLTGREMCDLLGAHTRRQI